jgi:hypothetical protein
MNNHITFGPAPPKTEFPDITTALNYCQDHTRGHGYCVVIRSTEKGRDGRPFRSYFTCDRGGKYRDNTRPSAKPRKLRSKEGVLAGTASRKTNCPFQLRLQLDIHGIWQLEVKQLYHNYLPSLNASAHPTFRRKDVQ